MSAQCSSRVRSLVHVAFGQLLGYGLVVSGGGRVDLREGLFTGRGQARPPWKSVLSLGKV